jgi:hypothetical protein
VRAVFRGNVQAGRRDQGKWNQGSEINRNRVLSMFSVRLL